MLKLKSWRDNTLTFLQLTQRYLVSYIVGNNKRLNAPPERREAYQPAFDEEIEIEIGCSVRDQTLNQNPDVKYGGV